MNLVSSLVSRLPMALKVRGVVGALGFTTDELLALDGLIKSTLGTPIVQVVLGKDLSSLSDLVTYGMELMESDAAVTDRVMGMLPAIKPYLSSDAGRVHAANFLVKLIESMGPNKEVAIQLLTKLSKSPLFKEMSFSSIRDFLANGLIPMAANLIPKPAITATSHTCSACGYVEGTSNEIS